MHASSINLESERLNLIGIKVREAAKDDEEDEDEDDEDGDEHDYESGEEGSAKSEFNWEYEFE